MVSNNKLDLKVTNCAPIDDRQYRIEVEKYPEVVNFDEAYVSVSGFFGPHGPHVFAAAPDLLESLVLLLKHSARPSCESLHHDKKDRHRAFEPCPAETRLYQIRIMAEDAIAKAKGETK